MIPWTKKPKVKGIYWYREPDKKDTLMSVYQMRHLRAFNLFSRREQFVFRLKGEWLGPISAEDYGVTITKGELAEINEKTN